MHDSAYESVAIRQHKRRRVVHEVISANSCTLACYVATGHDEHSNVHAFITLLPRQPRYTTKMYHQRLLQAYAGTHAGTQILEASRLPAVKQCRHDASERGSHALNVVGGGRMRHAASDKI